MVKISLEISMLTTMTINFVNPVVKGFDKAADGLLSINEDGVLPKTTANCKRQFVVLAGGVERRQHHS